MTDEDPFDDPDDDDREWKKIPNNRSIEARNMDELVMALRDIDGVHKVESAPEKALTLIFDLSKLDVETAWEATNIPEEATTLLHKARFIATGFGRDYNKAQDEQLPVIWYETAESVAARAGDNDE